MVERQELVVHFLAVFAIGLFTVGFIAPNGLELAPETKSSAVENPNLLQFQKLLNDYDSRNGSSPQPSQRLVLMVVDALRDDFLDRTDNLPYVSGELKANRACRLSLTVDTPTVTMPRIKSLVTGKASSFLDIILNLGSAELKGSNLVNNVAPKGVVFYGDDTWLKLLPNSFIREEGTHSFFVNDFYEVDANVTRHVSREMRKQDWHLLILHFLGLDHIGHVEGPRSALVGPKLQEMDSVVKSVRSRGAQPPLLLLTGDHGMHDGGGHGGATASERNVGLVLLGTPCATGGPPGSWAQVDLASTLAVLLGVDVPNGSAGALVPTLLAPLGQRGALTAQFSNAKRLLLAAPGAKQESFILEGMRLHRGWLRGEISEGANRAMKLYTEASILMRNTLATSYAPFDLYAMAIGAIIAVTCAVSSLLPKNHLPSAFRTAVLSAAFLGVHSISCGINDGKSTACSLSPLSLCLQLLTALAFAHTCCSIATAASEVQLKLPKDWPLLALATFHTFSLGSSFCVEEEHLVWFTVWPLVLVYAMVRRPQRWPLLVLMMLGHLVLSHINSTGDKWASVPDFEDWLASRPTARSVVMASGLAMLLPLIASCRLMAAVLLVAVYLHKAANKSVLLPFIGQRLSQSGLVEAWYFYGLLTVYILLRLSRARLGQRTIVWRDGWLLICALLRRPHDLWSLAYVAISSRLIAASHQGPSAAVAAGAVGWAGFFYQGNSNGLATLDVAAGYVGLSSYRPLLVAGQMIAHTFSAPVLVALELAASQGLDGRWLTAWSGQRLTAAAFYLLVAAWLREHLFVWSVFAPKLLYEGAQTLVYLIVLTIFKVSSL